MSRFIRVLFACGIGSIASVSLAENWPEYRGANNDGVSREKMLATWPDGGPKVLWTRPIGAGLGSFAVADGSAYYLGKDGDNEACYAFDVKTGKEKWSARIGETQQRRDSHGGSGPGSTPAIDSGKVYVYGSKLMFQCLDAADGKVLWKHDIQSDFDGQGNSVRGIKTWGNTTSPVIEGDLVIVMGGGEGQTFLAFNKTTGELVWKHESEKLTHSTPVPAEIHGVRQLIFIVHSGLVSLDPKTGNVLWKAPFDSEDAAAVGASPVVHDDVVYCSVGYGIGGSSFKISKNGDTFSAAQLWYNKGKSANQWSTPVSKDGHAFSIQGGGGRATLQCIELASGKVLWDGPKTGQGEVMLIDNKLLIQCADGKLLLAEATPDAYKEISTAQPLNGQAWGWPAYSDGVFLYRTATEMAALDLGAK